MVSGKPPRHSKSKAEPVTIDLDAKDVKAISAEGDAARTDDKAGDQTPVAKAEPSVEETKPAAADPAPVWDQPKNPPRARTECRQDGLIAWRTEGGKPCGQAKRARFTSCRTAKADAKPATTAYGASASSAAAAASKPAFGSTASTSASGSAAAAAKPHRPPPHLDRPNPPRHNRLNVNRPQPRA